MDAAPLAAFDAVGIVHELPDGFGVCASTHAAVRVVLGDVRARLEPILTDFGLLSDSEAAEALAERALREPPEVLCRLKDRVVEHYHASLVKRWAGWATTERMLVAEVAAGAKHGLIPAEGGGPLDRERFDAAIDQILSTHVEWERQYLFARWRSLAACLRHLRISDLHLPSLYTERRLIDGLGNLTAEALAHTQDAKAEAPAMLELLDVLRELAALRLREQHILDSGGVPDLDSDFCARLRPIVSEVIPRVIRLATMEIDALALRPAGPIDTSRARDDSDRETRKPEKGGAQQRIREIERLHHVVNDLVRTLDEILHLCHGREEVSIALMRLDQALGQEDCPAPEEMDAQWLRLTRDLMVRVEEGIRLWDGTEGAKGSRLRLAFDACSTGHVSLGGLRECSHHGIVLLLARVLVDPVSATPDHLLAEVGVRGTFGRDGRVARLRLVKSLAPEKWCGTLLLDLNRELAQVLARQHETSAQSDGRTQTPKPRMPRVSKTIDDAGFEFLCAAWDDQDPAHRRRPTWKQLAEAVHKELGLEGEVASTKQALKQRAPRCRKKWGEISTDIARERQARGR